MSYFCYHWHSQKGRVRTTSILVRAFWNFKLKVLKYPRNCSLQYTLIPNFWRTLNCICTSSKNSVLSLIIKPFFISWFPFLEKCIMSRYDVNLQFYGYHDGMGYWPKSELDLLQGQQFIFVYYVNSDVSYYQQIPVLSFWGFLSSAGGSIGLFLGFSCYSSLFTFTDFIKAKFQSTIVTQ